MVQPLTHVFALGSQFDPFDRSLRDADVASILEHPPFSDIDANRFPASASLEQIIRDHARVESYDAGDLVIRKGDYGDSAFFILRGSVHVLVGQELPEELLGRRKIRMRSWWSALSQAWKNHRFRDVRRIVSTDPQALPTKTRVNAIQGVRVSIPNLQQLLNEQSMVNLEKGEMFGEIAAINRTPRTATVIAASRLKLAEIRWQGLHAIRRRSPQFREFLDQRYRERSLMTQLRQTELFAHLPEDQLQAVASATQFESHGEVEWYRHLKHEEAHTADPPDKEPLIARQGHYVNDLILLVSGFARVCTTCRGRSQTLGFLGAGEFFGFQEILKNWTQSTQHPLGASLRALGYVDVLRIPVHVIQEMVLPAIQDNHGFRSPTPCQDTFSQGHGLLEFAVSQRFINGTATMVIRLDRCTGCDDCVRACAAAHDNNPRFLRDGKRFENFMVAHACMHCTDPVCMVGCPTGAIHRTSTAGAVVINEETCIGCGACAENCPYGNIRMQMIHDHQGRRIISPDTDSPCLQATKCDLCVDQRTGPACAYACPRDALQRTSFLHLRQSGQGGTHAP